MGIAAAVAGATAIGGIVSSGNQASAAESAAQTQANAADQAAQTQLSMYNQTRSDLAPYLSTGTSALNQLANVWGLNGANGGVPNASAATSALTQFPGYQFGLKQGQTALDQSAASQGLVLSGAQQQAQQQFGQNYAQQQAWAPYVAQLDTLGSLGESAGTQTGNFGASAASGIAANQNLAGAATASGTVGSANAITGGLNNALYQGTLAYGLQNGSSATNGNGATDAELLDWYG